MAHDVFISYASENKPIADAAVAKLEGAGVRCWVAPRDILPGTDYGGSIVEAISTSRVFVLVFSSHANGSPQVKREVERAVAKGLPILPFRIEDVQLSKSMEYYISSPHWLDAINPPMEEHLGYLTDTVSRLLGTGAGPERKPVAAAPPPRPVRALPFVLIGIAATLLAALAGVAWFVLQSPGPTPPSPPTGGGEVRPPTEAVAPGAEAEPNDKIKDATPLDFDRWTSVTIAPAGDHDIFKVTAPGLGYLLPTGEEQPIPDDVVYEFFNAEGKEIGRDWACRAAAGTYYVRIRGVYGSTEITEPFAFSVGWMPESDPAEPNDSDKRAAPLAIDESRPIMILPPGDEDWFSFDASAAGYVFANLEEELDVTFECLAGSRTLGRGVCWRVEPGPHFLVVRGVYGSTALTTPFPIRLTFLAEMDADEPNGDAKRAKPLPFGEARTIAILPAGDEDWFKLTVTETGYIVPEAEADDVGLVYECFRGSRTLEHAAAWRVEPGDYVLRVHGEYGSTMSATPFPLTVTFLGEMDAGEPNDDERRATPLEVGASATAALFPDRDADWFSIEVPRGGTLNVELEDVPDGIDPQLRLLAPGGRDLGNEPPWTVSAGKHMLSVKNAYSSGAARDPFTVRVVLE